MGLAAAWLGAPAAAQACAVCGHATTPGDPLGTGFYWGMLFLLVAPFSVVGGIGGWVAYCYWRARPRRPATERPTPAGSLPDLAWATQEGER